MTMFDFLSLNTLITSLMNYSHCKALGLHETVTTHRCGFLIFLFMFICFTLCGLSYASYDIQLLNFKV